MAWGRRRLRGKVPKSQSQKKPVYARGPQVVVPDPVVAERWNHRLTTKQNYEAMGLVVDPNKEQAPAAVPIELHPGEYVGPKEKYLTLAEAINCRELIMKHGNDYLKMWRDIKLNKMQHTRSKLKTKCELYLERYAERDPLFKPRTQ